MPKAASPLQAAVSRSVMMEKLVIDPDGAVLHSCGVWICHVKEGVEVLCPFCQKRVLPIRRNAG
jgi:hypothetical protein